MYNLTKLINPNDTISLLSLAEEFIQTHYTYERLKDHSAYFSDVKPNRTSFAFALESVSGFSDPTLPCIPRESLPLQLAELTRAAEALLGVSAGRTLFNIQRYSSGSSVVPRHFDGELMDFTVNEDHSLDIRKGLRPSRVAVLTLINKTDGGGTRLFPKDDESFVVTAKPGEVLVFDNLESDHGVDSFNAVVPNGGHGYIRYIIGWRALEDTCSLYQEGDVNFVTYDQAVSIQKDYIQNTWPSKYTELLNGLAPF